MRHSCSWVERRSRPRHYDQRVTYRRHPWGDADRDGVPNRYDRAPFNPYRY